MSSDEAIRKLGSAADSGFSTLRGGYHGPGNRWESNFKIPGAAFCNVDWRKGPMDVGEFYCDMGEGYTYESAADAMRKFAEPIKRVFPTWREIVKSDGKHPDYSDSDVRLFPAPHLKGERGPSILLQRIKTGDDYIVALFFDSVMTPDDLVATYGGPSAHDVNLLQYDYGRVINDLILASSRTWAMNRFKANSAIVTAYTKTNTGIVVGLQARYEFTGMNGPAYGTVTMTMKDGVPACLYFFDNPQFCRPADPAVVSDFEGSTYLK